ncbi:MAG: hypothetical protein NT079_05205, partial [Candidatus Omnitrophica bacterium]|nr:hypothetical protein [Candidatus Omnitrophota bacterium]
MKPIRPRWANYPSSITSFLSATPPYVNESLCGATISGYVYACNFSIQGYTIRAEPQALNVTGITTLRYQPEEFS